MDLMMIINEDYDRTMKKNKQIKMGFRDNALVVLVSATILARSKIMSIHESCHNAGCSR